MYISIKDLEKLIEKYKRLHYWKEAMALLKVKARNIYSLDVVYVGEEYIK